MNRHILGCGVVSAVRRALVLVNESVVIDDTEHQEHGDCITHVWV